MIADVEMARYRDVEAEEGMVGSGRGVVPIGSLFILMVAVGLAVGCAASRAPRHEYTLSPGRAFDGRQKTVLVLPINETSEPASGLEKGEALVFDRLLAYLGSKGLETIVVEEERFRRVLAVAAQRADRAMRSGETGSVASELDLGRTLPYVSAELGVEPDLVVVPNMLIRYGQLGGSGSLRWDGVRRRIPGTASFQDASGTNPAASLLVVVYDDEGQQIFSGVGGLDLLFSVNPQRKRSELIENRLEDADHLAEGVCVAFHPFFGEGESC